MPINSLHAYLVDVSEIYCVATNH